MSYLLYISMTIFVVYLIYICTKFGQLPSISESYYRLKEERKEYLFLFFCWGTALTILPYWIELIVDFDFLPFMACAGLLLVGSAPLFKSYEKNLHYGGAITSFICGYLYLILCSPIILVIFAAFLNACLYLPICKKECRLFYQEILLFLFIYLEIALLPTLIYLGWQ